jgi:citronellol/citronellal dehydrogenase
MPYLLKAENPHILNLAPPLNLEAKEFALFGAYSNSKYVMSLCTLGMSEEFRADGVAVNALWPRTAVATAAIKFIFGGSEEFKLCRNPAIIGDAAHVILTSNARKTTGQFFLDDEVLDLKDFR